MNIGFPLAAPHDNQLVTQKMGELHRQSTYCGGIGCTKEIIRQIYMLLSFFLYSIYFLICFYQGFYPYYIKFKNFPGHSVANKTSVSVYLVCHTVHFTL